MAAKNHRNVVQTLCETLGNNSDLLLNIPAYSDAAIDGKELNEVQDIVGWTDASKEAISESEYDRRGSSAKDLRPIVKTYALRNQQRQRPTFRDSDVRLRQTGYITPAQTRKTI